MEQLATHPAADLFPLMDEQELAALADDIRENGLRQPVVLSDGKILDGRNRVRACELAGIEPRFEDANGGDPVALAVSLNVKRRNLTRDQRAIAAAGAWPLYEVETGAAAHGKSARSGPTSDRTRDRLATLFAVNKNAIQQARALLERDPDAAEAVKNSRVSLDHAYEALRQAEGARERAEQEARELEREAEEARRRLTELAESGPKANLDLLPAPNPDEIREQMQVARELSTALPPDAPTKPRSKELIEWDSVLAASNALTTRVRNLPDWPADDPDQDLVRLAALDQSLQLADAAARIAAKVPDSQTTIRRVK
jgi:hypothetical protein